MFSHTGVLLPRAKKSILSGISNTFTSEPEPDNITEPVRALAFFLHTTAYTLLSYKLISTEHLRFSRQYTVSMDFGFYF